MQRIVIVFLTMLLFNIGFVSARLTKQHKIVGLVQVRNEAVVVEQFLRALALYTDSIVVLDDASDDNTVEIVEHLACELSIEHIIKNVHSAWQVSTENVNRQRLLDAGRSVGGTHFVLIDADEVFSLNCAKRNHLRNKILALAPGMVLRMPCINVWGGLTHYRNDEWCNPHQERWLKRIAFCDNGTCSYEKDKPICGGPAKIIHGARVPVSLIRGSKENIRQLQFPYVLMHFKYANLEAIAIKKDWYKCLEFIRAQEKKDDPAYNASIINEVYNVKEFECLIPDEAQMGLVPVSSRWLTYDTIDFSCFTRLNTQQKDEIERWFARYGRGYFAKLNLSF